jgi:hypothetical protein
LSTEFGTSTAASASEPPRSGLRILLWAAALLPFLFLALWRLPDGPGIDADDYGQYLMHAQALAEGRSYSDIGYIYSRLRYGLGPQSAPPGLPLTLAAVYKVLGPNILAMKFVMLGFAAAFVLLAGLYFARHQDRLLGIGVALLCGLTPSIAHNATQLLTDLPTAALLWAVIVLVDLPGRLNTARLVAITILGAGALSFRLPAAVLFPALIVFTALRYRVHGWRPLLPVLVWVLGVVALAAATSLRSFAVIRFGRVLEWDLGQIVANARTYLPVVFDSHLHPFGAPLANDLFHVLTSLVMAVGLVAWARKAFAKFGTIFAVLYAGLLLVVPFSQARYAWPLAPFFVFGLLNGVRVGLLRMWPAHAQRASATALALAAALVAPAMIRTIHEPRRGDLMATPDVQALVRELEKDTATGPVRVVFYKPRAFAWRTGIPAMGDVRGSAPCLISEFARARITHVVGLEGSRAALQKDIRALSESRPDLFLEEFRNREFVLYRFAVPSAEATDARAACTPQRRGRPSGR